MKNISKAVKACYSNMSALFKAIFFLGLGVFLLQQIVSGALNIYFIYDGYKNIVLKNLADAIFSSSFQLIALSSVVCIFGDFVLYGKKPE